MCHGRSLLAWPNLGLILGLDSATTLTRNLFFSEWTMLLVTAGDVPGQHPDPPPDRKSRGWPLGPAL